MSEIMMYHMSRKSKLSNILLAILVFSLFIFPTGCQNNYVEEIWLGYGDGWVRDCCDYDLDGSYEDCYSDYYATGGHGGVSNGVAFGTVEFSNSFDGLDVASKWGMKPGESIGGKLDVNSARLSWEGLRTTETAAEGTWKGKLLYKDCYDEGCYPCYKSGKGDWYASLLQLNITYKNTVNISEVVPIRANVTIDSMPISAYIIIKINNSVIYSNKCSDCIYNFIPKEAGTYDIEVIARYGKFNLRRVGKIEVISCLTTTLQLAEDLKLTSYKEIRQSEVVAASRLLAAEIDLGLAYINIFIDNFFNKYVLKYLNWQFPGLKTLIDNILNDLSEMILNAIEFYLGLTIKGLSPEEAKLAAMNFQIKDLEDSTNIRESRENIATNHTNFRNYIKLNQDKFCNKDDLAFLFKLKTELISNIVEKDIIISPAMGPIPITISTEANMAKTYDICNRVDEIISTFIYIIVAACIIVFLAAYLLAIAGALTSFYAVLSSSTMVTVLGGATANAGNFLEIIFTCGKLILAMNLMIMVPFVVDVTDIKHGMSIEDIKVEVDSTTLSPLYVSATSGTIGDFVKINSNGFAYVVTPDGRIVKYLRNGGDYIGKTVGNYTIVAYHHQGKLFSDIESTAFYVSKPNITANISYTLQGNLATIKLSMLNAGSTMVENITSVLDVRNSSNKIVFAKLAIFSLEPGEYNNLSYTMELENPDVYTATAAMSVASLETIEEKKISIPVNVASAEDAIIINIENENEYAAQDEIRFWLTVESLAPGLQFNISIPQIDYAQPVKVTGIEKINISLPKMDPDLYIMGVVIEKDGRILDTRIISFYVKANGVGLLTFNTTKLVYPLGGNATINLSLKDLYLNNIDADVAVSVIDPNGNMQDINATAIPEGYQLSFSPAIKGTYLLEAHAFKEGYRISNSTLTIIVNRMGRLMINVTLDEFIVANVTANGFPTSCDVTMYTPQGNRSITTTDGLVIFNNTNEFYILADKMFFEPALYVFTPYSISGTMFNDTNGNGIMDEDEVGLSGWTIRLNGTNGIDIITTTDTNGAYIFENLTSGIYTISEILQSSWLQTYPVSPGTHVISITDKNIIDIDFGNQRNTPPNIPSTPTGSKAGISSAAYSYSASATDPDGDQISYTFDWGDGANTTTDLFNSSTIASSTHSWNSPGQYNIQVKATDSKGESSEWSEARTVTIYRQGWDSLGGVILSNPFTIKDDLGRTHIFVKGSDNALWDNLDGTWLPLGGFVTSDPYAVKDGQGKIHVLVRGGDAALWDRVLDGDWSYLGGVLSSNPSAALCADNHVKVAVKGTDNALWVKDITTGSWTSLGGFITSNPQVILDANGRMHILVRGGDNALWDNIDGSWKPLGGFLTSDPKPLQNPNDPGYIHTYVQGGDKALWRNDLDTGADTATWQGLGGVIVPNGGSIDMGNSATVADVNGVAHAFVQGSDRSLWDNADGNWQGFGGFIKSSPNAIRDENGWLQVAVVGGDDALWVNRYGPA